MLPGQVLGSFTDYMVTPRHEGTYVFARGDDEVAVMFIARAATGTDYRTSAHNRTS